MPAALIAVAAALATVTLTAASGDAGAAAQQAGLASPKPNIVVVIVDDQPALDGRIVEFMPTVKSLFVDTGVTFGDFHSETPLCCPARASFLTGQHTHNHRVRTNNARFFDPGMSIATQLDAAGYHTFLVGKYMNVYGGKTCRNPANCAPTIPPGWDEWAAFGDPKYYNYELWEGDAGGPATKVSYGSAAGDYSTDVIAQKAAAIIEGASPDQPLLAWIAPTAPHTPGTAAPRHRTAPCSVEAWLPANWNEADVSDKPAYVRNLPLLKKAARLDHMCRALLSVDELVGRVRDALAASGRLANTVFIYSGDNGMEMGEHRLPLKSAPYQTQIPFYVRWANGIGTEGRTIVERVHNIDLAPTLAELADTTMGPFPNGQSEPDGLSFAGLLLGSASTLARGAVLDEMLTNWRGVPEWDAVTTTAESSLASTGCGGAALGLCRWHYIEYPDTGESELYDISNGPCWMWSPGEEGDPCELENAVENPAYTTVKAALQEELERLKEERGRP